MIWSTSAAGAEEHFISFDTPDDKLAGFIRLSLPSSGITRNRIRRPQLARP